MIDLPARERGTASILTLGLVPREIDARLVALFEELNTRHFDALLPLVPVCQGIPESFIERDDLDGLVSFQVHPRPGVPSLATVTIHLADELFEAPWGSEADRWQKIGDTLLHQMVHLAIALDALGGAHRFEDHHGEHFTAECNRIGEQEGWASVRASARDVIHNADAAFWPDNAIDLGADSRI